MTEYVRPSYDQLLLRIAADLAAVPAVLRAPLSSAWARACHGEHGHLDWVDRQISPITCELERLYDWAALYGVDRLQATAASGTVLATGNVGTAVLAQTLLRGNNGFDYRVILAVELGAGNTPVEVVCVTPGAGGNLIAGQTLTVIDPIPGVGGVMVVDSDGITGGAEIEDVESWRVRVVDEWRAVVTFGARSGKPADYRFWARAAHPSVSAALVRPHLLGAGTIVIRPICNALLNRLPTEAVITAVSMYLDVIAPATADWSVAVPIVRPVSVSIDLQPSVDTTQNRNNIQAALNQLVLAKSSEQVSILLAELDAAIASITTQYTRVAPVVDQSAGPGEVFVMQPVVWL